MKRLCKELEQVDSRSETIFRQRVPERIYRYKIGDLGVALAEEMKIHILRQSVATNNLLGKHVKDTKLRDTMTELVMALLFVDLAVSVLNAEIKNVSKECRNIDAEKSLRPFGIEETSNTFGEIDKASVQGLPSDRCRP